MSVYTITHGFHFDDVSAVQTLTPSEVQPGDSVVIAGAGAKFNGTFTVISVEEWEYIGKDQQGYLEFNYDVPKLNQVLYAVTGQADDEEYAALAGVPSADVELGTTMYAATLYRERGTSGDAYGAFDGMGNLAQPVTLHRIMQLLGCGRAQVA